MAYKDNGGPLDFFSVYLNTLPQAELDAICQLSVDISGLHIIPKGWTKSTFVERLLRRCVDVTELIYREMTPEVLFLMSTQLESRTELDKRIHAVGNCVVTKRFLRSELAGEHVNLLMTLFQSRDSLMVANYATRNEGISLHRSEYYGVHAYTNLLVLN